MNENTRRLLSDNTGQALWEVMENVFSEIKHGFDEGVIQNLIRNESQFQQGIKELVFRLGSGAIQNASDYPVIDCDADPFIPADWRLEEHRKGGKLVFDPSSISLFLSYVQSNDAEIKGSCLRDKLSSSRVLNANVLDYLVSNPSIIPEAWKPDEDRIRYIYFWGTLYRDSLNRVIVRSLYYSRHAWRAGFSLINDLFNRTQSAAILR